MIDQLLYNQISQTGLAKCYNFFVVSALYRSYLHIFEVAVKWFLGGFFYTCGEKCTRKITMSHCM